MTESEQLSAVVDSSPSASQPMEIEWLKSGRAAPKVGGASADSKAASLSDLVLDEMEATPTEGVASKTTPTEGGVEKATPAAGDGVTACGAPPTAEGSAQRGGTTSTEGGGFPKT